MINRTLILTRLEIQEDVDGQSPYIEMLRLFVAKIKRASQWEAFVDVKRRKYGELSYQYHIVYYPKPELVVLLTTWGK